MSGVRAAQKAVLRLRTTFLLICLATLWWPGLTFAVPAGTVINNTAQVSYDINTAHYNLTSNTEQFTVDSTLSPDLGNMAVAGQNSNHYYPGSSASLDISIDNTGGNSLDNGFITIDTDPDINVELNGANVSLVTESTSESGKRKKYSVSDLAQASSVTYQAQVDLPLTAAARSASMKVTYEANDKQIYSEDITLNISARSSGTLKLMQYSTASDADATAVMPSAYLDSNNTYQPIPAPQLIQAPGLDVTASPVPLKENATFSHDQVIFIVLDDPDQNISGANAETVEITLSIPAGEETETIKLQENGADSGVFTGYITLTAKPAVSNDGVLDVNTDTTVSFKYVDGVDQNDTNLQEVLIDPYGIIFNSTTGALLNGYTVSMVNADTGLPASVYGDDGVSSYPATVVTGGSVTDSGGTVYHFADGAYRFPFAPAGNYKLVVTPPADVPYRWPSSQSAALINQLPAAPYAITLGSRGEVFPLNPGPPLHIDIPVDPLSTQMYVQRSADKNKVAPGDFIHYQVSVENVAAVTLNDVVLTDTLPHGFRFQEQSLLVNGLPAGAPQTSDNGAELTGGAAGSNTAEHYAQVINAMMRDRALLMGQVLIEPREGDADVTRRGLEGARIYLEDGRYAVTDERGMYHFEDIKPGSHVVQLDLDTIPDQYEVILSEDNTRFAGRAWSQFVDVRGGTLWRTDFHVANKPIPVGNVSLQLSNEMQRDNHTVPYRVDIRSETVAIENMRFNVLIPEGAVYLSGSSRMGERAIEDPTINDNMLSYRLGDADAAQGHQTLRYAILPPQVDTAGEMITKGFLLFDTPAKRNQRTPVADHLLMLVPKLSDNALVGKDFIFTPRFETGTATLNADDKFALAKLAEKLAGVDDIRIHTIGHADGGDPGDKTRLSQRRALAVANELQQLLQLSPGSVSAEGKGTSQPFGIEDDEQGRQMNRRVEIRIYRMDHVTGKAVKIAETDPRLEATAGQQQTVATQGKDPAASATDATSSVKEPETPKIVYDAAWLQGKDSDLEWLQPAADGLPDQTSTAITLKHGKGQFIELKLNGQTVPRVNYEGSVKNQRGAVLSLWKGVDLQIGDNMLEAVVKDSGGTVVAHLKRSVHVSGGFAKAELVSDASSLVADGRSHPVIALRMTDKDGYPLRPGMGGQFRVKPPYHAADNTEFDLDVMPGAAPQDLRSFNVGADGIARIKLAPTSRSGEVEIELPRPNQDAQVIKARLQAEQRDWILVGLAEGTAGHNLIKGNSAPLQGDSAQQDIYQDGRLAFFAKGQVLGKWLLTLAYDSDKERVPGEDPNLFQIVDPDSYYTVYGDNANDGNDAASSEKLYLKLEREAFYLLFGDYETDFNETELALYSRTLTGVKSQYEDEKYDITVFTSQTNQSFVKDEFRGEGRSGPYRLSRSNIAMNSEKVVIETRDRLRSEEILERVEMQRHTDYNIDYREGTITFREPIFSVNQNFNHVFIVVKYEAYDAADERVTYGLRAQTRLSDKLSVGVTHVNEGRTGGEAKLSGVDADYQISDNTELHVEAARSVDRNIVGAEGQGDAYIAELKHETPTNSSKAYVRETDTGFGLGQTNGSEDSTRKIGAETRIQASASINLSGQAYRQEHTATEASRDLAEVQAEMNLDSTRLRLGLRGAVDSRGDGSEQKSEQVTSGITQGFFDNRLIARADHENNVSDGNSIDFPDRTRLGADLRLNDKISLFAEQEISDGQIRDTRHTLIGVKSTPWSGGTLYTGVSASQSAAGESTAANVAGTQTWQLSQAWSMDIGAEQSKLFSEKLGMPLDNNVPFVNGPAVEEFVAASLGLTYMAGDWMWTGRIENRNGDSQNSHSLATSMQTTPHNSLSMLASLTLNQTERSTGEQQERSNVGLSFAYRPNASRWILLDKLNLISDESRGAASNSEAQRVINMFHANYKHKRWQLSLQYGAKRVTEVINLQTYTSFTDMLGVETRYDLSRSWDIGLHGNVLRAAELDHYDYSGGLSIGHSVAKNIWISIGYNFFGFRDEDFSGANYTSQGVFLRFRMKFDQVSVREAVKWAGQ